MLLKDKAVCRKYGTMLANARGRSEVMSIASCGDGMQFMTERMSHDMSMDYEKLSIELSPHVNGNRIFTHGNNDDDSYTSEMYIGYTGEVTSRTTLLALWGCDITVNIPEYRYVRLFCDRNTRIRLSCDKNAHAVCVYYGEIPDISGEGYVKLIKCK